MRTAVRFIRPRAAASELPSGLRGLRSGQDQKSLSAEQPLESILPMQRFQLGSSRSSSCPETPVRRLESLGAPVVGQDPGTQGPGPLRHLPADAAEARKSPTRGLGHLRQG